MGNLQFWREFPCNDIIISEKHHILARNEIAREFMVCDCATRRSSHLGKLKIGSLGIFKLKYFINEWMPGLDIFTGS